MIRPTLDIKTAHNRVFLTAFLLTERLKSYLQLLYIKDGAKIDSAPTYTAIQRLRPQYTIL